MENRNNERTQIIVDYYGAVDARQGAIARSFLSPNLEFGFANGPVHHGPDGPAKAGAVLRTAINGMKHGIEAIRFDDTGCHATVELTMTYDRKSGVPLNVPACVLLRFDDSDKFDRYRVYVDASELGLGRAR